MNLASNLLALALVVGMSWVGMVILSARFHGSRKVEDDLFTQAARGDQVTAPVDQPAPPRQAVNVPRTAPCPSCDGSGAQTDRGRLQPCPRCEGTGVH